MEAKNYKAVVFDLFGTLVGTFSSSKHDLVLEKMSKVLFVENETFAQLFDYDMRTARELGEYSSIEENIEVACNQLGVKPKSESIKTAASYRYEFMGSALSPREDAVETLTQIKSMGCAIGLISDCSPEVPILWPKTPFAEIIDASVFSCEVGIKKPVQKIYQILCEKLGVEPNKCLYVGDGDSSELEGALEAGMDPILIRVHEEDDRDRDRPSASSWKGKRVSCLSDVLQYV